MSKNQCGTIALSYVWYSCIIYCTYHIPGLFIRYVCCACAISWSSCTGRSVGWCLVHIMAACITPGTVHVFIYYYVYCIQYSCFFNTAVVAIISLNKPIQQHSKRFQSHGSGQSNLVQCICLNLLSRAQNRQSGGESSPRQELQQRQSWHQSTCNLSLDSLIPRCLQKRKP